MTANLAYSLFDDGGCMYSLCQSFVSQLTAEVGEPFASFPTHMMRYGHGGIGGFGSVCGALNGAAALVGLVVTDKKTQDAVIADLFRWYERTPLPGFRPETAVLDLSLPARVCGSTLCHASITSWARAAGYRVKCEQRKERCRRLTGDVAAKLTVDLNQLADGSYTAPDDSGTGTCMTCHGPQGKLGDTGGKMACASCHTQSLGHRLFSDLHYRVMDKKE